MSHDEPKEASIETGEPDAAGTLLVVGVGAIVVAIAVVFVQGLYQKASRAEFERKVVQERPAELEQLRASQLARLQGGTWVDKKEGIVTIPIERAMERVVKESAK